jgi:DNA-binding IclR family transcriptional regulator
MISNAQAVTLPRSQGACLFALRLGNASVAKIAMNARLSVKKVIRSLAALESSGLAEKNGKRVIVWRATLLGETCLIIPEDSNEPTEGSPEPSQSGRRLLELLDRPIEGRDVAKKLGLSRQGAKHVLRALHRQGHVRFADPNDLSWWVMRADDETPLLTREQERVLSAIPRQYATDAVKIMRRTNLPADRVDAALKDLVRAGLSDAVGEFNSAALFRATANGIEHLQNRSDIDMAEPPHLPVYSDRVRGLLSAIGSAGALRVRDVKNALGWSFQATNSLMQYLKRKGLIQKAEDAFDAPYILTPLGGLTLGEMTHRGQITSGYDKNSVNIITPVGSSSPGRNELAHRRKTKKQPVTKPPRLPVQSERVLAVLTTISNRGAMRIKAISDTLRLAPQSTNSLIQYLKRKDLVQQTDDSPGAPYALTSIGRAIMLEMEQRRAA